MHQILLIAGLSWSRVVKIIFWNISMIPCSLVNSWVLTFCACVFFSQKSRPQDRNSSLTNLKSLFASWNFFVIRHYVTQCKSERNRSASFILFWGIAYIHFSNGNSLPAKRKKHDCWLTQSLFFYTEIF